MFCGEPLYWIYYDKKFVGCIFYTYHESIPNEYKFVNDGVELRKWLDENKNNYKIHKDFKVDLLDTGHEDYDLVIDMIRCTIKDHLNIR